MAEHERLRSYLELGALPGAVPCARLHTKHVLWEWQLGHLTEAAEHVVSELVTNALEITTIRQLSTPLRLWLSSDKERVLIEVWDGDPQAPKADGIPAWDAEHGRGLVIVEALSKRWNWYPTREMGGKVVWAVIGG